ncbi:MAG: hypothetical protein UX77_C0005G0008 [Parcubacteria group bacterium GW2011_GWA1_47_11]|nr:MAG: hypothetical protein UX29_C0009G0025 [Parcubacteria group bacterium GW2011_GWA2_46_10]KKU55979.1 MAG: hypothetical protein UX77_C0005G0008 [Parcubacteria group bacterium GW2011_GWA1_47_11]
MLVEIMRGLGPEFFDIFGVLTFIYIIFFSHTLLKGKRLPKGFVILLLVIGLIGFFVDLFFASSFLTGL